jgi:hypothetical protein
MATAVIDAALELRWSYAAARPAGALPIKALDAKWDRTGKQFSASFSKALVAERTMPNKIYIERARERIYGMLRLPFTRDAAVEEAINPPPPPPTAGVIP